MMPEKPLITFPGSVMNELNNAYCVAVYAWLVRLERYAMKTAFERPALMLSALMTTASQALSGPIIAISEKSRLVAATMIAPRSSGRMMP